MKKSVFLAVLLLLVVNAKAASKLDTIYYDKEMKGVEIKEFCAYYRVLFVAKDSNFANKYKTFRNDGSLFTEGQYISIDKYDDKRSIFDGVNYVYFENGQIAYSVTYTNGEVSGPYFQYFPSGKVERNGIYVAGKENDVWCSYDEVGHLLSKETYKEGILNGLFELYDANGIFYSAYYKNGVISGLETFYDEEGRPLCKTNYKDGLKLGPKETRNKGVVETIIYEEIDNASGMELQLSVAFQNVTLGFSKLFAVEVNCFNPSSEKIVFSIDNISAEYVGSDKKGRPLTSGNQAYTGEQAMAMQKAIIDKEIRSAYSKAQQTAQRAATSSSQSTETGVSRSSSYGSGYAGGSPFALTGGLFVGGGRSSKTTSTSTSHSSNVDGLLEYQIRQAEMEKAQAIEAAQNEKMRNLLENFSYTFSKIDPQENISKVIYIRRGLMESKKVVSQLSTLRITFSINNHQYVKEIPASSIVYSVK